MPKAKKILITTATREVTIYRAPLAPSRIAHCSECGAAEFLDLDSAAELSSLGAFRIMDLIRTGNLHAAEAPDGRLRICRKSLFAKTEN